MVSIIIISSRRETEYDRHRETDEMCLIRSEKTCVRQIRLELCGLQVFVPVDTHNFCLCVRTSIKLFRLVLLARCSVSHLSSAEKLNTSRQQLQEKN